MRDWVVGGALIEASSAGVLDEDDETGVLLVENLRRSGIRDWTTPGGVIDAGEELIEGLAREVHEETGLVVVSWSELVYKVEVAAPGLDWHLQVEVYRAIDIAGDLSVGADPDGIVISADWSSCERCVQLLESSPRWVGEPLLEWVNERFDTPRDYVYEVSGDRVSNLRVERL